MDIRDTQPPRDHHAPAHQGRGVGRPWIGVRFTCAGAYLRVYRKPEDPAYVARCPKCNQCVRFRVGATGTNDRFFDVSC